MDATGLSAAVRHETAGRLAVEVHPDREAMAAAAAARAAETIRAAVAERGAARVSFAAAPSQAEMLASLIATPDLPWDRVTAFHIDDYVELPPEAPERFANWLQEHVFSKVPLAAAHPLPAGQGQAALDLYAELLAEAPIDLGLLGVGVNGHIAFNDPPVADFADPLPLKQVELDDVCRQQQVDDGCFPSFAEVPTHAVTFTVPTLMAARRIVCTVPGKAKHQAVARLLAGPIGTDSPATILREHPDARLYLDKDAADG